MTTKKKKIKSDLVDLILDEGFSEEDEATDLSSNNQEDVETCIVSSGPAINSEQVEEEAKSSLQNVKEKVTSFFKKDEDSFTLKIKPEDEKISNVKSSVSGSEMYGEESIYSDKVHKAHSLQIAQKKISELESINSKMEYELSELRSSGEVLYNQNQELKAQVEKLNKKIIDIQENHKVEKDVYENKLFSKQKVAEKLKLQVESLDLQLKVEFQKIKSRERELENRIEIMKMENKAVVRSKDELILELKRNLDEISIEMENFKVKGRDLHVNFEATKDKMRKSIKALRLALNLLENDEDDFDEVKRETA